MHRVYLQSINISRVYIEPPSLFCMLFRAWTLYTGHAMRNSRAVCEMDLQLCSRGSSVDLNEILKNWRSATFGSYLILKLVYIRIRSLAMGI